MSLASRCPDCKTLNPTSAAQLQSQNGHLTCGHCGTLFSGIDHLTPADEDTWQTGAGGNALDAVNDAGGNAALQESEAQHTDTRRKGFRLAWVRTLPNPLTPLLNRMSGWPRFARRWTLLLTAFLLLQLLWWQRLAIAMALPFLSPALAGWSELVGTDMAGTASTRLKIMASSLKASQDNRLQLEVRISNAASTPSRWPALDVQLLDSKRETVSSITLRVSDYAVTGSDHPPRTLKPGEDAEIIAWIDTDRLNAQSLPLPVSGFKVMLVDVPRSAGGHTQAHSGAASRH